MAVVNHSQKIVRELKSFLKDTFGPNGLDVMLFSSSGNILITNYGSAILKSVSVSDPVGRIVREQVISLSEVTGDGTTTFMLVLSETLQEISRSLKISQEKQNVRELMPEQKKSVVALSKAFTKVEPVVSQILQGLSTYVNLTPLHMPESKLLITNVIRTHLNGKYPDSIVIQFTELLCTFILGNSSTFEKEKIEYLIDSFSQMCLEVVGVPVTLSRVIPGILVPREFTTEFKRVLPDQGFNYFRFIVIQFQIDNPSRHLSTTLELNSSSDLDTVLTLPANNVHKMFRLFQKQGVKLILSTETVSNIVLHFCHQFKIAFVQMIPDEYVALICHYAKIQPAFELGLEEATDLEIYLGKSKSCKIESVGNHGYCHLEFYSTNGCNSLPNQLVLCAPTRGLCQQNSISLLNALKCVRMLFSQNDGRLQVLPGGGTTEFVLSEELKKYCRTCKNSKLSEACSLFSTGLLAVPRQLHLNSQAGSSNKNNFIHLLPTMRDLWCKEQIPLGINSITGNVFNPAEANILEPFHGKQFVFSNLLQLIAQLLRVDGIVRVKGRLATESLT